MRARSGERKLEEQIFFLTNIPCCVSLEHVSFVLQLVHLEVKIDLLLRNRRDAEYRQLPALPGQRHLRDTELQRPVVGLPCYAMLS